MGIAIANRKNRCSFGALSLRRNDREIPNPGNFPDLLFAFSGKGKETHQRKGLSVSTPELLGRGGKTLKKARKSLKTKNRWLTKGWFSKRVVLTRVRSHVPPERKPERGYVRMFPGTKTGMRAHSSNPPFYETALLCSLDKKEIQKSKERRSGLGSRFTTVRKLFDPGPCSGRLILSTVGAGRSCAFPTCAPNCSPGTG